jgi:hypothetical protein
MSSYDSRSPSTRRVIPSARQTLPPNKSDQWSTGKRAPLRFSPSIDPAHTVEELLDGPKRGAVHFFAAIE